MTETTDYYEAQIDALHEELAALYAKPHPSNNQRIDHLWARIERLEAARVRMEVRAAQLGGE